MWSQSAQETAEGLGMEYDAFFCGGSDAQWQDTISQCAAAGYDGLLVSHGNQDGSYVFLKELTENYPDLKLVCFDTQFYTDGEYQKIEGVTQLFQQDKSLVTVLLDEMIAKFGEGVRLVKVWRGPNYNSPFDRREVGWQEYEEAGKIVTVGEIQPLQDSVDSANSVTAAYLQSLTARMWTASSPTTTSMARACTTRSSRTPTSTVRPARPCPWRPWISTRWT